jgi:hypothetical protein
MENIYESLIYQIKKGGVGGMWCILIIVDSFRGPDVVQYLT